MSRGLIVNADDLGLCEEVNAGVLEAHDRGIVTSASLMVRRPAAASAAERALAVGLDLGLHVELGEWRHGPRGWYALGEVPAERIEQELELQLAGFRELAGGDPSHIDSHQHVHLREPARTPVVALAARLGVPLRHLDQGIRYCGDFYGQTERGDALPDHITASALAAIIASLDDGVTELCCHPARGRVPASSYDGERLLELSALCDPSVRAAVDDRGVHLIAFRDVAT